MSQGGESTRPSTIESAMDQLVRKPDLSRQDKAGPPVGRRAYDQALTRRLEQIHAALGTDDQPVSARSAPAAEGQQATLAAPGPAQPHAYGIGVLLLTGLLSAVAGAALMWVAIYGASRGARPASPAAVVAPPPVAVAPAAAPAAAAIPVQAVDDAESKARELVENWRRAWSARDIEAYLGCYSADFVAANGQPRGVWAAARRAKLEGQSEIAVQVRDMKIVRLADDRLKVEFLQDYSSGSYQEIAQPKTLLLVRNGGGWLISGEWSGARPPSPPVGL